MHAVKNNIIKQNKPEKLWVHTCSWTGGYLKALSGLRSVKYQPLSHPFSATLLSESRSAQGFARIRQLILGSQSLAIIFDRFQPF